MRISIDNPKSAWCRVYLNDKEVKIAVAADDEEGWVDIIDLSVLGPKNEEGFDLKDIYKESGYFSSQTADFTPGSLPKKRLNGYVRFEFLPVQEG